MTGDGTPHCARCGKTLQRSYQFCPECGLPASGGSVLSSQIGVLRQELKAPVPSGRPPWRRLLVPTASAVMTALVLAVGLLLFNRPLIEMFFPPAEEAGAAPLEIAPRWEPQWVLLPKGSFHVGPPFEISDADLNMWPTVQENVEQHRITNGEWMRFLIEDEVHLRELGVWEAAIPLYAAGWKRDPSGRPVIFLRHPETGEIALESLLEGVAGDVDLSEILLYRQWVTAAPEYRIKKLVVTNDRWLAFLHSEERELRAEGQWEQVVPGPGSGWHIANDGFPSPPRAPAVDVRTHTLDVCAATLFDALARLSIAARPGGARDVEERHTRLALVTAGELAGRLPRDAVYVSELMESGSSLIQSVSVEALRRFHEWASRVDVLNEFEMSRYEIRNVLWREFLEEEESALRQQGLWSEAVPGPTGGWVVDEEGRYTPLVTELDMPVRGVSARAVRVFGDYLTRRLGEPGVEIRMPTPLEWQYAARGQTWNTYSWGDSFRGTPVEGTGGPKTRRGIEENGPTQVDYVEEDVSPLGVVALGLNVAEWVESFDEDRNGDGVIERNDRLYVQTQIRCASFAMGAVEAEYRALVWDKTDVEPWNQYAYCGVRLVKVRTRR